VFERERERGREKQPSVGGVRELVDAKRGWVSRERGRKGREKGEEGERER
jgi:hypothetical protein